MAAPLRPDQIEHEALRRFAERAAWIAKVEDALEAVGDWIDFDDDLYAEERAGSEEETPLRVAYAVVSAEHQALDTGLEDDLIEWLARDPEHWGIFRLIIVEPWQDPPGVWRKQLPAWILPLCTNAAVAHYYFDQYGRRINRPLLDID